METIVLVIHLILALAIIGLVLIQRSSGGGLGIGGGGMGDFATARSTANALTRMTTIFAFAFFITSLTLAWLAGHNRDAGVLDSLSTLPQEQAAPALATTPDAIPAEGETLTPQPQQEEPEVPISGE